MQEKQRAFLVRTAYWAVWAVLLWLGVRYLLRWLLPFLLALALAAAVEPVIAWCRRRMGLKRGFTAAVVTIAVTGAILALAAVIVWQLIRQAAELLGQLPELLAGLPGMTEDLRQRLEDFCAACPQGLRSWLEEVPALLGTLAAGVAQRASEACITAAAAQAPARIAGGGGGGGGGGARGGRARGPPRRGPRPPPPCRGCSCSAAPRPWRCSSPPAAIPG